MRNLYTTKTVNKFTEALFEAQQEIRDGKDIHVSISDGNRKMGRVASVSLLPYVTCPARALSSCAGDCYAARDCIMYSNVLKAWARNTALMALAPVRYWKEVTKAMASVRWFRFHVGGDIPNFEYFCNMVDACIANEHCEVLCFTKRYEAVNKYIEKYGDLPKNLHIMFSGWQGLKPINPNNLPETNVLFPDMDLPDDWLMCGGNCSDCGCRGVGCWQAQKGQTIAFKEH